MFNVNPPTLGTMKPISGRMADRAWSTGVTLPDGFSNPKMVRSIAPDNSMYIENILSDAYADMFYNSRIIRTWMKANNIAPIEFGGGVIAITVMMLDGIPEEVLRKLKFYDLDGRRRRVTKAMATKISAAIDQAVAQEP